MSFFLQLFPGVTFVLSVVNMTSKKMEAMMQLLYFELLSLLRVNRHITKEWRILGERFHDLGLPNFVVLCFTVKVFFMEYHTGFNDAAGETTIHAY